MTDHLTMRAHLEAVLDEIERIDPQYELSPIWLHAMAMLDQLDKAEKFVLSIEGQVHAPMRAIYDPAGPGRDERTSSDGLKQDEDNE